jgi:hypothetical protein
MRDSNREPRVRIIIIHVTVFFFGIFVFFMYQINTARGMVVNDMEKRNEGDEGV